MPKLPLFQNEPIHPDAIASFRHLLQHPQDGDNMDLINALLDLYNDPSSPISDQLALFAIESCLLRSQLLATFLFNTAARPHMPGKPGDMQLQIKHRILECAAAAGFLPTRTPFAETI